jgi:hypothetical protein
MRRIISKEEQERKSKRNQFFVGGILILVMVLSTIGYSLNNGNKNTNNNEKLDYNKIIFTKDSESGLWDLNKDGFNFSFYYNPNEVSAINYSLTNLESYKNKPLYIYSEDSDAATEIYRNFFLNNPIVERVQEACIEEENCSSDLPVKNCTDNFIIIKESDTNSIKLQGNCIFIEGNNENLTKITDSFLYKIIGVQ